LSSKIRKINIKDKEYPELLKKIENPPKELFVVGKIFSKENCFAVVGTRSFSIYGKELTFEIVSHLCQAGLTIVSGLAPGIDTFSHQACLKIDKRTIAVLGTGLDKKSIYPKENIKLAEKIVEKGGALISEYPPGTQGSKFTFPKRNRIIAGLSFGVLVVEGKLKSGALITANFAKKYKRKIFALPGPVNSLNSKASHLLIKKGAFLVETANDILEKLNLPFSQKEKEILKESLSFEEKIILKVLSQESLHIDAIVERTGLSASKAAGILNMMAIEGKIKIIGPNFYAL
jgi:DNA processing protein